MTDMPWFKFYPDDWLSGTRSLTAMEAGVYITLIAMMYDHGKPLVMDEARLARYCGATPRQFSAALRRLIEEGKIISLPGGLWNARVASELQEREEKTCKAKKAVAERENRKTQSNQGNNGSNDDRTMIERSSISDTRSQKLEGGPNGPPERAPQLPLSKAPVLVDIATATAAFDAYNAMALKAGLSRAQSLTEVRRKHLAHRLKECGGLDGWRAAMDKVAASSFLTGKVKPWRADLDFILQASSFTKIMEGSYDDRSNAARSGGNSIHDTFDAIDAYAAAAIARAGGSGSGGS